VSRLHTNNDIV